jgi:ATP-dependent DNA helicase RecG
MKTAVELFEELNAQDETTEVEAKGAGPINRSIMETVCAFSNEPDLGGGYILIGADKDDTKLFPYYTAEDIGDADKLQSDLATNCNTAFNIPVRPRISVELVNGLKVMVVHVDEVSPGQKPVYFKHEKLPHAAYRRIGPTDHRCEEDDLRLFYADTDSYDRAVLKRTTLDDIDPGVLDLYRSLLSRVNPASEVLTYGDNDLLMALGCLDGKSREHLTVGGLLLFGSSAAQRRELPMVRADYIRVPGTEWVGDPDDRFRTVDMRGPLIKVVYRLVEAVHADLPKGFMLEEGRLQADSTGLPVKALREAIVNALMHRSYRENSPIQVIRYDNRIEIRNPGYSLKSEDHLGSPGSQTRNPVIAAVFHDTNLAETKGSGIRAMRRLLEQAHLAPPTFESDRAQNLFIVRLLLHHFLNPEDIKWLMQFDTLGLNDHQKQGLIMVRELGAIDNSAYRQLSDADTLRASQELRQMRELGLLEQKGKGRATYYVPGRLLNPEPLPLNPEPLAVNPEPPALNPEPINENSLRAALPPDLLAKLDGLKQRESDKAKISAIIHTLCSRQAYSLAELTTLLKRKDVNYVSRNFIKPMIDSGRLKYRYPEVINHPEQAYEAVQK